MRTKSSPKIQLPGLHYHFSDNTLFINLGILVQLFIGCSSRADDNFLKTDFSPQPTRHSVGDFSESCHLNVVNKFDFIQ